MPQSQPTLMVMAGGTGGHVFPGLAVAHRMQAWGWRVVWLGNPAGMEATLVPKHGIPMEYVRFGGVRGKGLKTRLTLPLNLLRALAQSLAALRRARPDVVLGMGGYITFPAGMMSVLLGRPLVLHEQNSVAGLANRVLAKFARRVLVAFPDALPRAQWTGNPVRAELEHVAPPQARYAARTGALRLLVVGGSLGAAALNEVVPRALALLASHAPHMRLQVVHQAGAKHIDALRASYAQNGLLDGGAGRDKGADGVGGAAGAGGAGSADRAGRADSAGGKEDAPRIELVPFIDDMASAYANADLVICRAGAMTVAEIAAVGVAAYFVPFPYAVDDHQTTNATFLAKEGAAIVIQQRELTAEKLADWLRAQTRDTLAAMAARARALAKPDATDQVAHVCAALAPAGVVTPAALANGQASGNSQASSPTNDQASSSSQANGPMNDQASSSSQANSQTGGPANGQTSSQTNRPAKKTS